MIIREKVRIGDQLVTLETGRIAKQAGGSCVVRAGDTMVLVTVCGNQDAKPGQSFFPLSVDYQEKTYAAGKIPGGFFKREGKLRDYEVLVSRLIDRPCRPLFPEGYLSEVQVVATVMSFDQQNPPDTLAMIGASAALHMSQIPWKGPIAGVRVGRVNGEFVANPTFQQMAESDCELLVAASRDAIVMVEGEADEISEADMIDALQFAHRSIQSTLDLIDRMREAVGKPKWKFAETVLPASIKDRVERVAVSKVREACNIADKQARGDRFKTVRKEAVEILGAEFPGEEDAIKAAYDELKYNTMRAQVLDEGRRLDGRDTRTVRPISIELGVLPRVHGSTLFTRGETQAIVATTLGTTRDSQRLDTLRGDEHKHFILHYNFPPYSVGEVKPMRGPGRREVGHGNLAERALAKMMPTPAEFPYTVRLVSEITESNGSSSMASVCGGALALMDAGVPLKAPVAGVAMGLIKEGDDYAILTDILGDEDALGDMDFKVCGTEKGVTAIQMDIKIDGLTRDILERALRQAREARIHILDKMRRALAAPRAELSQYAPRITQIRVKPDQVRTIIGPGGKMIRAIVDQTGASIDVADDGTVSVSSADSSAVLKALEIIKSLTTEPEIGEVYEGTVKRVEPYGAFIEIMPGKDGLCHISDIDVTHVTSVEDYLNLGDKVMVKVTNIDREGRIRLSRKDALGAETPAARGGREPREERPARPEREERAPRSDRPVRPEREERAARPERAPRIEREERAPRIEREERAPRIEREDRAPRIEREERAPRIEREDRFAAREERKPREIDADERPKPRVEREDRFVPRDREERKPRDIDADERPKPRVEREDRFVPREERKPRDIDADERPKPRVEREDRFVPREERKPREIDADERPKPRVEREDRFVPREERKPRDIDADERPKPRVEREDRFVPRDREERKPRAEREDRPIVREDRPIVREDRPVVREERKPRELDADERPKPRIEREDRFVPREERKPREIDADERPKPRIEREDRFVAREDRKPREIDADERPKPRIEREDRFVPRAREDRFKARDAEPDERPKARDLGRDERPKARTDEPRERPARVRDEERAPARALDREPRRDDDRPARPRDLDARRDDDRPARPRDEERTAVRARDLDREPRRDDDRAPARPRDDGREPRRDDRPRDDDRPARPRRDERPDERPRGERAPREEAIVEAPVRDREDRTERERPSRLRARNRERVREVERERERR
jgi:polyribonucleotide nucleotidyltransferase